MFRFPVIRCSVATGNRVFEFAAQRTALPMGYSKHLAPASVRLSYVGFFSYSFTKTSYNLPFPSYTEKLPYPYCTSLPFLL